MTRLTYPLPSKDDADENIHRRQLARILALAMQGRINCVIDVTLANAAQTVVKDGRLHPQAALLFDPLSEEAADILRTGPLHIRAEDRAAGSCTITHDGAAGGAEFLLVVLG
jgi:hypothetical protein